jgi:hypothetical protein
MKRFALGLALLLCQEARAADVSVGWVQGPGGYYSPVDRSGPYAVGPDGSPSLLSGSQQGTSSTIGGVSAFSRMSSSASGANLTTAKPSAGRAYVYQGCNTTASTIYMRVYNAASAGAVTVGSTVPFAGPYAFPANTCIPPTTFAAGLGIYASAGITYAFGTSPADSDTTAIGAGALAAFQLGFQ